MSAATTLDNCDQEPIHIPGAIQPHGVLLACHLESLEILQASTNAAELFQRSLDSILAQPLTALFAASSTSTLERWATHAGVRVAGPPLRVESEEGQPLEVVMHRSGARLIAELEPVVEQQSTRPGTFDRSLRDAMISLQRATSVDELCAAAADRVRDIAGFDRVMVYRFDASWNGQVVAEARRSDLEPFLGLNYPASDIPAQARRLYTENWLRLIRDVEYTASKIEPELDPESQVPLDLSHAHLRSVSPIHIEYLKNMGVRASMSISLTSHNELIGLIACHHYSGAKAVHASVREAAEFLGQALSWNLSVLERADESERARRVQAAETQVITTLSNSDELLDGLATDALLSLTEAAGAAIVLDEGVRCVGETPDERRIGEIVGWLRQQGHDVFATDQLTKHYPGAVPWASVASGLLAAELSRDLGEYLLWFRPSTERQVNWAGDPNKQAKSDLGPAPRLSPRGSFELWRETIRGRSLPWARWQIEAASNVRRLLLGGARRRAARLRSLNQQLVDADRAKDTFIATVSHELRNPLNAITGWAQLAASDDFAEGRRREALQIISRNAEMLNRLVDDLLDVSSIVGNKVTLDVESVDLATIIESVLNGMSLAAESKGVRIKRILDSKSTTILGDAARIRQIVTNLISNALKFTPKHGSVHVTLATIGSDVEIAVRDSGVGIDAAYIPHVFDLFSQAHAQFSRKSAGLGLGLAIAKRLVELHGGRITAESEGEGHGAVFRVRLPIASTSWQSQGGDSLGPPTPANSKLLSGLRLLVTEDEADSRELLRTILANAGAHVDDAPDGITALLRLDEGQYDVLISDIGMPGMDGLELIRTLRRKSNHPLRDIPAVALTAYVRTHDRTAALRAGYQAHVPKPADPEELITVVASLVHRLGAADGGGPHPD